jgi:hypothetical protein
MKTFLTSSTEKGKEYRYAIKELTCTIQPPLYHRNYSVLLVLEKRDKEILQLMRIPYVKF